VIRRDEQTHKKGTPDNKIHLSEKIEAADHKQEQRELLCHDP
jgi:hypothetical protein